MDRGRSAKGGEALRNGQADYWDAANGTLAQGRPDLREGTIGRAVDGICPQTGTGTAASTGGACAGEQLR